MFWRSKKWLIFYERDKMDEGLIDIDEETTRVVQQLAEQGSHPEDAVTCLMIEKLRRLEDLARNSGVSRQAFQKIASARRVVGDKTDLGPLPTFS